ncbi:MAG: hypothetical protein ACSHXF_10500 [Aquaticitalea sp.]
MKTFVVGLIFLGFTNLMNSQNEIASVDVNLNEYAKPVKNTLVNSNYYYSFDSKISSGRIRNFQNLVANYDIKMSSIYSADSQSNYTIVFEEGLNQIKAEYNQDGKIVQCSEVFKNIKLPLNISSDIAKKYPGWEFKEVVCNITYVSGEHQTVMYKVEIQNDTKRKHLKINAEDYDNSSN